MTWSICKRLQEQVLFGERYPGEGETGEKARERERERKKVCTLEELGDVRHYPSFPNMRAEQEVRLGVASGIVKRPGPRKHHVGK